MKTARTFTNKSEAMQIADFAGLNKNKSVVEIKFYIIQNNLGAFLCDNALFHNDVWVRINISSI